MNKMRLMTMVAAGTMAMAMAAQADSPPGYGGSTFDQVWGQVSSDRYDVLPHFEVTTASFFEGWRNRLVDDARRTLQERRDLLPRFRKLLHPNGICLAGVWRITQDNPYSGYFAPGREGLFIGRASTALTEIYQGEYRAFGLAGKIFPTMDPSAKVETANFVTIEDLGGTLTDHFLDAGLTNDIIHISIRPSLVFQGPLAFVVGHAFMVADRTIDVTQTLIRQLHPISTLAEAGTVRTPVWLMITGDPATERVDRADFRDELRIEHHPDGIVLDIFVADRGTRLGNKEWQQIGRIEITDTAASDSCDRRLHFAHPRFQ